MLVAQIQTVSPSSESCDIQFLNFYSSKSGQPVAMAPIEKVHVCIPTSFEDQICPASSARMLVVSTTCGLTALHLSILLVFISTETMCTSLSPCILEALKWRNSVHQPESLHIGSPEMERQCAPSCPCILEALKWRQCAPS